MRGGPFAPENVIYLSVKTIHKELFFSPIFVLRDSNPKLHHSNRINLQNLKKKLIGAEVIKYYEFLYSFGQNQELTSILCSIIFFALK